MVADDIQAAPTGDDTPGEQVGITPEMVQAGVHEARDHCLGEPLASLVCKIYIAMALERK